MESTVVVNIDTAIEGVNNAFAMFRDLIDGSFISEAVDTPPAVLRRRATHITSLRQMHRSLQRIVGVIGTYGSAVDDKHKNEIEHIRQVLSASETTASETSETPAPGIPIVAPVAVLPPLVITKRMAPVGAGLSIPARWLPADVSTIDAVKAAITHPDLYYVPSWGHFAFRVGEMVFHSGMGEIFINGEETSPVRVKDCKHPLGSCPGGSHCTYYHDPVVWAGSKDVKNFMSDSWLYSRSVIGRRPRYGTRRLGCVRHAISDLGRITDDDLTRFLTQIPHDLICAILATRELAARC